MDESRMLPPPQRRNVIMDAELRETLRIERERLSSTVKEAGDDLDKLYLAYYNSMIREELIVRSYENFKAKEKCPACECTETPRTVVPELRMPRSALRAAVVRRARVFRMWITKHGAALLAAGILALALTYLASRFVRTLIFLSQ